MDLTKLKSLFSAKECKKIYVKRLALNDNSKNQIYFGSNFEILNILPISEIKNEAAGEWSKERFKASINFSWIHEDGLVYPAPNSQLILYPKYPEVRFSGFLRGCANAPLSLMTQRLADRLLFFSVSKNGDVLGHAVGPDSEIAREFLSLQLETEHGVFKIIELEHISNNRIRLFEELYRIHALGWIKSKRLDGAGNIMPCNSANCGGYTLEAELGITPNGYSNPDFLGWEIKQFGVKTLNKVDFATITLMTPEPTHGLYVENGVKEFILRYGYLDKVGRENRMNFGGIHKIGVKHPLTNLKLELIGFDIESGKIRNSNGRISLLDNAGIEAASWSFSSMLLHWNRKHNQACYIPSLSRLGNESEKNYFYSNNIILGTGTDFQLFLTEIGKGNIYYDPGIKMENMYGAPLIKKRSQFRIKSKFLPNLYKINEKINLAQRNTY